MTNAHLDLAYRIGYCDAQIDALNVKLQEAMQDAKVSREKIEANREEKGLRKRTNKPLRFWHVAKNRKEG